VQIVRRNYNIGAKRAISILKENGFKDVTYIIGGAQGLLTEHAADLVK
jgi:23S rRNA pseudoU1915 N3-methylase RlmH